MLCDTLVAGAVRYVTRWSCVVDTLAFVVWISLLCNQLMELHSMPGLYDVKLVLSVTYTAFYI